MNERQVGRRERVRVLCEVIAAAERARRETIALLRPAIDRQASEIDALRERIGAPRALRRLED